jgi:hypothetical protein
MSALPQIKKNAQWVIDHFGPQSGQADFGYNAESFAYLDAFIDRQGASFRANEPALDRIVSLLGAFVGEAILATFGGQWQDSEQGVGLSIMRDGQIHFLQPFHQVYERLTDTSANRLHSYFAEFLPEFLSDPPAQN